MSCPGLFGYERLASKGPLDLTIVGRIIYVGS
jgi:hypothetical protein